MKKSNTINKTAASLWLGVMMSVATNAQASIDSNNLLDNVLARYSSAASSWASVVTDAASWLFWTLVLISMVWTFGMMAMRKADIGEFFAEFTRFTIFTGFFWWLLINGPNFATDIMDSLRQIGGNATGLGGGLSPSGIVDVGFAIFDKVLDKSSVWSPVNSAVGMIISAIILVILALIGVNMLLLLAAGWILAYGGIFFLGFGGSRWTSDMAINYYKTVLGIAAQLLTMVLLVGIGKTFLDDYYNSMDASMELRQLGVMLVVAVILLMLFNKVPQLIAGIITGASVGGMGIGQFGAGAMVGAAGMATAAASMVGAMAAASAAQGAGGVSALMASFSQANTNVAAGNDVLANVFGGSAGPDPSGDGGRNGPGGGGMGTGNTPFAQAAGFASAPIGTAVNPTSSGDGGSTASGSSDSSTQNSIEDTKGGKESKTAGFEGGRSQEKADSDNSDSIKGSQSGAESASGGVIATAGKAGRIGADAAANLARGAMDVAKAKGGGLKTAALDRISETAGGKIAGAIKAQDSNTNNQVMEMPLQDNGPTFSDSNLSQADSQEVDTESEVAAFVGRDNGSMST